MTREITLQTENMMKEKDDNDFYFSGIHITACVSHSTVCCKVETASGYILIITMVMLVAK